MKPPSSLPRFLLRFSHLFFQTSWDPRLKLVLGQGKTVLGNTRHGPAVHLVLNIHCFCSVMRALGAVNFPQQAALLAMLYKE